MRGYDPNDNDGPEPPPWDAEAAALVRAGTNRAQRRSCSHQIKGRWCVHCGTEVPA